MKTKSDIQNKISQLNKRIENNPSFDANYFNRGLCQLLLNQTNAAISDFDNYINISPETPKFLFSTLADLNEDKILFNIDINFDFDNDRLCFYFGLGYNFSLKKLTSKTLRFLEKANILNKNNPLYYQLLGIIYSELNNKKLANKNKEKSWELDDENKSSKIKLFLIPENDSKLINSNIDFLIRTYSPLKFYGDCLYHQEKLDESCKIHDEVLTMLKNDSNTIKNHAIEYFDMEYIILAYQYFKKLIAIDDKHISGIIHILEKLAWYLGEEKYYNEAYKLYDKIRELDFTYYIENEVEENIIYTKEAEHKNNMEKQISKLKANIFQAVSHTISNIVWSDKSIIRRIKNGSNSDNDIRRLELLNDLMLSIMNSIKIAFSSENVINSQYKKDFTSLKSEHNISLQNLLYFCLNLNLEQLIKGGKWGTVRERFFNIDESNEESSERWIIYFEQVQQNSEFIISKMSETDIQRFGDYFKSSDFKEVNQYFDMQIDLLNEIYVMKDSYSYSILFIILLEITKNMLRYGSITDCKKRYFSILAKSNKYHYSITFENLTYKNFSGSNESTLQGLEMVEQFSKVVGCSKIKKKQMSNSDYEKFSLELFIKKGEINEEDHLG